MLILFNYRINTQWSCLHVLRCTGQVDSTTTLRYSLGGYLESVMPPLATSSRCHQLWRHAASRHSVGNDPRVLPQGLPRVHHATIIYIDTLPSFISSTMAAWILVPRQARWVCKSYNTDVLTLLCFLCFYRQVTHMANGIPTISLSIGAS